MERIGRVLVEAIVLCYGRQELLRRLAHPFWFQSLGCVMGMDWHSSGITTSVISALKRGLDPIAGELGVQVCGGRGRQSRKTPLQLVRVGERTGLDGDRLARTSRLVAKVDSAAVQDGFQLYLHGFVVTDDGDWCVIQQGMDPARRQARRYHWLSERVESFVEEPHQAIEGPARGTIVNLTDRRAARSRLRQLDLLDRGPDDVLRALASRPSQAPAADALEPRQPPLPHLSMPAHHDVRQGDVISRRLRATLTAAADRGPRDFAELLLTPGLGARTVESLALAAEIIFGAPHRFDDPARFSMAHGGKDGHPFPVPLKVYDRTIVMLRQAVARARLGQRDRFEALRRLDEQARSIESTAEPMAVAPHLALERRRSAGFGGRTVTGPVRR